MSDRVLRDLLDEARHLLPVECYDLRARIHDALFAEAAYYVPSVFAPAADSPADPANLIFESYGDGFAWFRA